MEQLYTSCSKCRIPHARPSAEWARNEQAGQAAWAQVAQAGRAQALERDLSSVRLCDAEDGGSATEGGRCFGWPSVTLRDLRLPWANNLGLIGFLPL